MSTKVTVQIRSGQEDGAPTVGDLLNQVRDYFEILASVEQAVSETGVSALEWRVVSATTNSPITLEAMAFARDYGVNIDRRAAVVAREVATGLQSLVSEGGRPRFFDDKAIARAERIFERVTNGLDRTIIGHGADGPTIELTPPVAHVAAQNAKAALAPPDRPYTEIGSVEGRTKTIDQDGYGRQILRIHERLSGRTVKCIVTGQAEKELGEYRVRDIWRNRRVRIYGTLHFKGLGRLAEVDATMIRFLREPADLPDWHEILDPNYTDGRRSEDYIEWVRNGRLS